MIGCKHSKGNLFIFWFDLNSLYTVVFGCFLRPKSAFFARYTLSAKSWTNFFTSIDVRFFFGFYFVVIIFNIFWGCWLKMCSCQTWTCHLELELELSQLELVRTITHDCCYHVVLTPQYASHANLLWHGSQAPDLSQATTEWVVSNTVLGG